MGTACCKYTAWSPAEIMREDVKENEGHPDGPIYSSGRFWR